MNIKNSDYVGKIFSKLVMISKIKPNSTLTETVLLENCLDRRLSENVCANQNYPSVALSAICGKMLNIHQDITTIEQFKKIDSVHFYGTLRNGKDPYKIKIKNEYETGIPQYIRMGTIGNTVITTEQFQPWFDAAFLSVQKDNALTEINKGSGVIKVGDDYKEQDIILKKDDVITNTKKALLRQAGIEYVQVYKNTRFAILCVDYELDHFNKNFELEYIKDSMKSWGYRFEVIKIKPSRYESNNRSIEDFEITTDIETYIQNIKKITEDFDYIVACGLAVDQHLVQLGLFRSINELNVLTEQGLVHQKSYLIGNSFKMMVGGLRSPIKKETIKYLNEKGIPFCTRTKTYEDRAIVSYIPGYILDIIINMHIFMKPTILSHLYNKPVQPEWKIGVLNHDFDYQGIADSQHRFFWGYASDVHYGKDGEMSTTKIAEIKIIKVENERPDMLSFFSECNCFIPMINEDMQLKAGDYFYYLEI